MSIIHRWPATFINLSWLSFTLLRQKSQCNTRTIAVGKQKHIHNAHTHWEAGARPLAGIDGCHDALKGASVQGGH